MDDILANSHIKAEHRKSRETCIDDIIADHNLMGEANIDSIIADHRMSQVSNVDSIPDNIDDEWRTNISTGL